MNKLISLSLALFLMLPVQAFAKAKVSISIKAEKEIVVNKVAKKVEAKIINPGDVIFYTLNYVNAEKDAATDAVLEDPIPKGTTYITGSAYGKDAEITFSIDGGKTFKKPSLLTYEYKSANGKIEKRSASPEEYTHIRWTINTIPAHGSGRVGFQVRVK